MISVQPAALQKITARHLSRQAMLYVRQSTLHQVLENTESTARQYGLRERALALGWPTERVVVIDQDLGQSGASAVDREGFQRLVAEVGLGHVGLVMGLEVSRLARSSLDWHRLLELCSIVNACVILRRDNFDHPFVLCFLLVDYLQGSHSRPLCQSKDRCTPHPATGRLHLDALWWTAGAQTSEREIYRRTCCVRSSRGPRLQQPSKSYDLLPHLLQLD